MKSKLFFPVLILIFAASFSCCSSEDCEPGVVQHTDLESEYNCVNTKYQLEIDLNDQFTIIKSQDDYNSLITGSCSPDIDFEMYDLIIGKRGLTAGNTSIEYEYSRLCDQLSYSLKVVFNQNATTEAPNLTYHALVPKIDVGTGLEVLIEEKF